MPCQIRSGAAASIGQPSTEATFHTREEAVQAMLIPSDIHNEDLCSLYCYVFHVYRCVVDVLALILPQYQLVSCWGSEYIYMAILRN